MATTTKVIGIGDDAGIILPEEFVARLNVQEGDSLFITEEPGGFLVTPFDPEFVKQMEATRENRDVPQKLAE